MIDQHFSNKTFKLNKLFFRFNVILTGIYIVWAISPYLTRNLSPVIVLVVMLLWVTTAIISHPVRIEYISKLVFYIYIWNFYMVLIRVIGHGDAAIGNLLTSIIFWFPGIIYIFYKEINNRAINKYLSIFTLGITIYIVIVNISIISENPAATKVLTGSSGELSIYYFNNTNLGDFSFVQTIAILTGVLVGIFISSKKTYIRIFIIVPIILFIYMIILSASVITIISLLIMLLFYFYYKIELRNKFNKILLIIFFIIVLLMIITFKDIIASLFFKLSLQIENQLISERVFDISTLLKGNLFATSSLFARMDLYKLSLITFLENPFFGKGMIYSLDHFQSGIGMHSQVFDDMARYGIVGIIMYRQILISYLKNLKTSIFSTEHYIINKSILMGALFMAIYNPLISIPMGMVIFIILPFWPEIVDYKKNNS